MPPSCRSRSSSSCSGRSQGMSRPNANESAGGKTPAQGLAQWQFDCSTAEGNVACSRAYSRRCRRLCHCGPAVRSAPRVSASAPADLVAVGNAWRWRRCSHPGPTRSHRPRSGRCAPTASTPASGPRNSCRPSRTGTGSPDDALAARQALQADPGPSLPNLGGAGT